jgi:hypothetical protein
MPALDFQRPSKKISIDAAKRANDAYNIYDGADCARNSENGRRA